MAKTINWFLDAMLKRLLAVFGNKTKSATPHAVPPPAAAPNASAAAENELITVYDAYGREVRIARGDWREKVLLPNLEQNWKAPDALYSLIVSALNDGFAADVLAAAQRLVAIDPNPERGHTIHGIALMKNGNLDGAEETLRAGMAKAGETAALLTNLAKVVFERGEEGRSEEILWQAVQKDPNLDNALMWWVAIQRDRAGEAGYVTALRTVSALSGSWRAQLWLARYYLDIGDIANARSLYDEVLGGGLFDGGALMMISGDLGNHGLIGMIPELVGPVYQPKQHDPVAGLNLLRAFQELRRVDEGEALLAKLYALGLAPFKQNLDQFAQAFQQMRAEADTGKPIEPGQITMSTKAFTQPIWHYGLRNADWLFRQKPEDTPQVGFFAFSMITSGAKSAEEQREDGVGRMSRAIPLYMAEATHYWTDFAATTFVVVADGGGPVVFGAEPEGAELFDLVAANFNWLVTGQIGCSSQDGSGEWRLSVRLWDCGKRELAATETATSSREQLGATVLQLEHRLLAYVGKARSVPLDGFYLRPSREAMEPYLVELGQAFILTLHAVDDLPRSALWGERAMLDWPLNMALHWQGVEVPKLMYLSGLGKAMDFQSEVLPEYRARTLQLLKDAAATDSPTARLAPLVWKIFGMSDELAKHQQGLPSETETAYREWLDRVANPPVA